MNQEQFNSERNYRVSVAIAKAMFLRKLITEQEYKKINKMLIKKYNPVIGGL